MQGNIWRHLLTRSHPFGTPTRRVGLYEAHGVLFTSIFQAHAKRVPMTRTPTPPGVDRSKRNRSRDVTLRFMHRIIPDDNFCPIPWNWTKNFSTGWHGVELLHPLFFLSFILFFLTLGKNLFQTLLRRYSATIAISREVKWASLIEYLYPRSHSPPQVFKGQG